MPETLFHGSNHKFEVGDYLKPFSSHNTPGQKVVYATPDLGFALAYTGGKWDDSVFMQGSSGRFKMLVELAPGNFDRVFKNRVGYIYLVSRRRFRPLRDEDDVEFVSTRPVKILQRIEVSDILSQLKRADWNLVSFDDLMAYIVKGLGRRSRSIKRVSLA